jgi:hypothetical protein
MRPCDRQASGDIELYFYGELEGRDRASVEQHLASCEECSRALEELSVIRTALSSRPVVSAPRRRLARVHGRSWTAPSRSSDRRAMLHKRWVLTDLRRAPDLRSVSGARALLTIVTMSVDISCGPSCAHLRATPCRHNLGSERADRRAGPCLRPTERAALERSSWSSWASPTRIHGFRPALTGRCERQLASALLSDTRLCGRQRSSAD